MLTTKVGNWIYKPSEAHPIGSERYYQFKAYKKELEEAEEALFRLRTEYEFKKRLLDRNFAACGQATTGSTPIAAAYANNHGYAAVEDERQKVEESFASAIAEAEARVAEILARPCPWADEL